MVATDIHQQAIPWSRLLLQRRHLPTSRNLGPAARLSAGLSLVLPGAFAATSNAMLRPWALLALASCLALLLIINRSFYALLWRQRNLRLTFAGLGLLILYLIYLSLSFASPSSPAKMQKNPFFDGLASQLHG